VIARADVDDLVGIQARSYRTAGGGLRSSWPEQTAMGRDELEDFLDRLRYGVLATARTDGRPHAAPIAFSLERGAFWIGTVRGPRLRNLRANPWAALVVIEGADGVRHRALTGEGPVRLHEGPAYDAARRQLDEGWSRRHGHVADWAVAFIELRPERLFSYSASNS
jgi:nitroimidazol reductase NimA-like FMN-containing flavoprotein (pyridoxamine 5'-phosphate oxidase superfamily)